MAPRNSSTDVVEPTDLDVDVNTNDDETETISAPATVEGETKEKTKKEPARGTLPDGYVTPVGLAKVLTEPKEDGTFYHTGQKDPNNHVVAPQMVYSYMKNAKKDDPFPLETVTDSLGHERQALRLEAGIAWWERKNARANERRQNAAEKAAKAAEKAAAAPATTEAEGSEPQEATVEAE
jgi:hypothetical protein